MKKVSLSTVLIIAVFVSCSKIEKDSTKLVFETSVNPEEFLNFDNTKRENNAHTGNFYNVVDSITVYGAGCVKKIDDTLQGYDVDICVNAWVRESMAPSEGAIAVSLNKKSGETKDWTGVKVDAGNFKANEWIHVIDTFKYKSDFMSDINEIRIFAMKQNGADSFDIDDLRVKYIFHK